MIEHVLCVLLGFALGICGVICGAVADRIRYGKASRHRSASPLTSISAPSTSSKPVLVSVEDPFSTRRSEVIAALVHAGYTKDQATTATAAVPVTDWHTTENWLRAALRRMRKGAA